MDRPQRTTFLILLALGLIYFAAFIPANLTGAQDVNMISVFEHDEYAQYPYVIHMLTPGETFYQSVRNFVVYLHYYYGYPFYFFSALSLLPVKWIFGSDWALQTPLIMLVLRQMINVLPILLSVFLLVWLQTRFKSRLRSILLFLFLISLPAVFANNLWWHPDSLLTFFSVLTIFFLTRDDFRFGRNFYLSAVSCGLAIGSKLLGVLFVITYAVYLGVGLFSHRLTLKKALGRAALYLLLLLGVVVLSNPLLLLPMERAEIIAVFKANLQQNTLGFWVIGNTNVSMFQQIVSVIKNNYASVIFFFLSLVALIHGIRRPETRLLNLVILTWVVGYLGYFLVFAATMREHYLIPVALPLLSSLSNFLPSTISLNLKAGIETKRIWLWGRVASALLLIGVVVQIGLNGIRDGKDIISIQQRETTSASIMMFHQAEDQVLQKIKLDRKLRIYRDWRAYVADRSEYDVKMNWDLATYPYLQDLDVDVLFIERENMIYFSDAAKIPRAIDPERMKEMVAFYSDALEGNVTGYVRALETDFGAVFVRESLYQRYLK